MSEIPFMLRREQGKEGRKEEVGVVVVGRRRRKRVEFKPGGRERRERSHLLTVYFSMDGWTGVKKMLIFLLWQKVTH